ncbi:MAG: hypothetical protein Q4G48_08630 [Bacteroidia bacterium]|nr:hypothetical protein [Bacteroidia bacterium]
MEPVTPTFRGQRYTKEVWEKNKNERKTAQPAGDKIKRFVHPTAIKEKYCSLYLTHVKQKILSLRYG